jgi:transketolase
MLRNLLTLSVVAVLAGVVAAGEMKSGPQVDEKVPGPFHPMNLTGDAAGEKKCLFCESGQSPVAMIFARSADCEMTAKLLKKLDETTIKNKDCSMYSFVVFLSDDDKMEGKLKEMAEKAKLKKLIVSLDNAQGPPKYKINKDADITVVLYTERTVKANYSFAKGKMTEKDLETIVKDVSKITPTK